MPPVQPEAGALRLVVRFKETMRALTIIIALAFVFTGCVSTERHSVTLTGTIIEKPWAKSGESWNAGGGKYFVLDVGTRGQMIDDGIIPRNRRTANEGVILKPSKQIQYEQFSLYTGRHVRITGEYVDGKPYVPPSDHIEQMPVPHENSLTGKLEYPIRGSGFRVEKIIILN